MASLTNKDICMKKRIAILSIHCVLAALAVVSLTAFVNSNSNNTESNIIATSNLCLEYSSLYEEEQELPKNILRAIALTESGRWFREINTSVAWPWTINVKGKGYHFDTKEEAIAAVKSYQKQGIKSIDVGCMQINLKYHPEAFENLEQALDPEYNVAYAADFIRKNKKNTGLWQQAVGVYHSRYSSKNRHYIRKVYSNWKQINKETEA